MTRNIRIVAHLTRLSIETRRHNMDEVFVFVCYDNEPVDGLLRGNFPDGSFDVHKLVDKNRIQGISDIYFKNPSILDAF